MTGALTRKALAAAAIRSHLGGQRGSFKRRHDMSCCATWSTTRARSQDLGGRCRNKTTSWDPQVAHEGEEVRQEPGIVPIWSVARKHPDRPDAIQAAPIRPWETGSSCWDDAQSALARVTALQSTRHHGRDVSGTRSARRCAGSGDEWSAQAHDLLHLRGSGCVESIYAVGALQKLSAGALDPVRAVEV